MANSGIKNQRKVHIDNIYLIKKFNDDYMAAFNRFYDYIMEQKKTIADINILVNIVIDNCLEGMEQNKKANVVIPKDLKEYTSKISRGTIFKEMKKKIRNQDYEKLLIGSIWSVFAVCIVLFFLKNLMMQKFVVTYIVDVAVACIAGAIAVQNFTTKRRIIKRYNFDNFYIRLDVVAFGACVFIKFISPSNFDISYLILVISFFIMKKKIKPQFEQII